MGLERISQEIIIWVGSGRFCDEKQDFGAELDRNRSSLSMAQHSIHAQRPPPGRATQTVHEAPRTVLARPPQQQETVTLVLRPRKKVSWDAKTVDNEHMAKKSSKICCVFHRKESLEDDSSDDEDGGGKGTGHCHHDGDKCSHEGKGKSHFHPQSADAAESS